jgi:predicted 3-demethylubiquinone-9 3-methyltransferase (glyoxalase superfamily)
MPRTYPCLWFDTQAQEAAEFYTSLFPNSRIVTVTRYPEGTGDRVGEVLTVSFELDGAYYLALNGGPEFTFDEAISITIDCEDQAEIDRYWDALVANGGQEGPCGWLKDKYGLSWQVVPTGMEEVFSDPDPERAKRAMEAMLKMRKLDIEALRSAAAGAAAS